jgi:hypothetical protein
MKACLDCRRSCRSSPNTRRPKRAPHLRQFRLGELRQSKHALNLPSPLNCASLKWMTSSHMDALICSHPWMHAVVGMVSILWKTLNRRKKERKDSIRWRLRRGYDRIRWRRSRRRRRLRRRRCGWSSSCRRTCICRCTTSRRRPRTRSRPASSTHSLQCTQNRGRPALSIPAVTRRARGGDQDGRVTWWRSAAEAAVVDVLDLQPQEPRAQRHVLVREPVQDRPASFSTHTCTVTLRKQRACATRILRDGNAWRSTMLTGLWRCRRRGPWTRRRSARWRA